MNTMQQNAITDRGHWQREVEHEVQQVVRRLAELAKQDFAHQTGPRGLEEVAAYREVRAEVERITARIAEEVEMELQEHMLEARRARRAAGLGRDGKPLFEYVGDEASWERAR